MLELQFHSKKSFEELLSFDYIGYSNVQMI